MEGGESGDICDLETIRTILRRHNNSVTVEIGSRTRCFDFIVLSAGYDPVNAGCYHCKFAFA